MRYPEFQNDSDDEDEDEEDEEDSDEDGDDIKLPKLITKEAVIAILRPDFVRFNISHLLFCSFADIQFLVQRADFRASLR